MAILLAALVVAAVAAGPVSEPPSPPGTWELTEADASEPFCPERATFPSEPTAAELDAQRAETARLEPMLGVVLAYGTEHPESWSSYGLRWITPGDASVYASFTHDLAAHRAALLDLVPYPDELIVCRTALTDGDVRALHQHLLGELEGRFLSLGMSNGRVTVGLHPSEIELAAELHERYDDAVDLTVGLFPYPMPEPLPEPRCDTVPASLPALTVAAPAMKPVALGAANSTTIEFAMTNTSNDTIEFFRGVWTADLTRRGGTLLAAQSVGFVTSEGYLTTLPPGASEDVRVRVPTAACDPAVGYEVPPGEYDLYVLVEPGEPRRNVRDAPFALGPVPITLAR